MKSILLLLALLSLGAVNLLAQDITRIHTIQGTQSDSPLLDEYVTIEGIVTADYRSTLSGFFVQEETVDMDNNYETSEGIWVKDDASIVVGDLVQLRGKVQETSSLTQLRSISNVTIIANNQLDQTSATKLQLPITTSWEAYEGMWVQFENDMYVTDTEDLALRGQVQLSADSRAYQFTEVNEPSITAYQDYMQQFERSTILLDDAKSTNNTRPIPYPNQAFSATNPLRSGAKLVDLQGIVDYYYGFKIQPLESLVFQNNERLDAMPSIDGNLKVASFNLFNYFNGNGQGGGFPTQRGARDLEAFKRQHEKLVNAIVEMSPTVLGLLELENDGYNANSAIQSLVNGINETLEEDRYEFVYPNSNLLGDDVITVGIIYDKKIVRELGTASTLGAPYSVFNGLNSNRRPLAQTFEVIDTDNADFGTTFTYCINHFKSKGGTGSGNNADKGDGQANWNAQRVAAAQAVSDWLKENPTGQNTPHHIIMGDINCYAMEDPIVTFAEAGYKRIAEPTSYSYEYYGQWGNLDHVLVSNTVEEAVKSIYTWPINADEPKVINYQDTEFYEPDWFRSSDHDPLLLGLSFNTITTTDNNIATLQFSKVYPNPAAGEVIIEGGEWTEDTLIIEVYNQFGQLVLKEVGASYQPNQYRLDVSNLPEGYYQMLMSDNKKQEYHPLIKVGKQ